MRKGRPYVGQNGIMQISRESLPPAGCLRVVNDESTALEEINHEHRFIPKGTEDLRAVKSARALTRRGRPPAGDGRETTDNPSSGATLLAGSGTKEPLPGTAMG